MIPLDSGNKQSIQAAEEKNKGNERDGKDQHDNGHTLDMGGLVSAKNGAFYVSYTVRFSGF
jgi:hypothetical protein